MREATSGRAELNLGTHPRQRCPCLCFRGRDLSPAFGRLVAERDLAMRLFNRFQLFVSAAASQPSGAPLEAGLMEQEQRYPGFVVLP